MKGPFRGSSVLAGLTVLRDRVLPGSEAESAVSLDTLNLIFIIAFAVVIALLAQYIARRNKRRK